MWFRRWILRFNDPQKLDEIGAFYMTVKPKGGNHKSCPEAQSKPAKWTVNFSG
jgi:hypothetical protein